MACTQVYGDFVAALKYGKRYLQRKLRRNLCRPEEDYLEDGTVVKMWPPPGHLAEIAQDNTIYLTSSTCGYADLTTNWVKHVHGLNIGCFYIVAADQPTAGFFEDWLPTHASQMPAEMSNKV